METPRVGGEFGGIAWTGGRNLALRKLKRPKTIFARRPTDFRGADKIEDTITSGLPYSKRLAIDNSPVSLTSWVSLIRVMFEDSGMDTVFRILSPDNSSENIFLRIGVKQLLRLPRSGMRNSGKNLGLQRLVPSIWTT